VLFKYYRFKVVYVNYGDDEGFGWKKIVIFFFKQNIYYKYGSPPGKDRLLITGVQATINIQLIYIVYVNNIIRKGDSVN